MRARPTLAARRSKVHPSIYGLVRRSTVAFCSPFDCIHVSCCRASFSWTLYCSCPPSFNPSDSHAHNIAPLFSLAPV